MDGAPEGPDAGSNVSNVVVRQIGEPPKFDFAPRDHVELRELNGWAELERIARVSGTPSYVLKGRLALLEQVLWLHAAQRLTAEGFAMLNVPAIAHRQAFVATGHFPFGGEGAFQVPRDDLYLAGTAEIVLNSLHAGEILADSDLPLPCLH